MTTIHEGMTAQEVSEKVNVPIALLGPVGLKQAIEEKALAEGVSKMEFMRQTLADAVGFTLPPAGERNRKRKYATAEEREKAAKDRSKDRRDLINRLLAANKTAAEAGAPIATSPSGAVS